MAERIVSQKAELQAEVKVTRQIKAVINPNGRGYSEDNVTKYLNNDVLTVTVKAANAVDLRTKVDIIMSTIEEENDQ